MKRLPKPIDDAKKVYLECISNTREISYKEKLGACVNEIDIAAKDYEKKKSQNEIHKIQSADNIGGLITAKDMEKLYNNKMVNKKGPGRKYYDKIMVSPQNGICPICGHREVSTLDHYLSKMKYPAYAVTLINLIPSCKDCNFIKGESEILDETNATIHPYYDDIENSNWLSAVLNEEDDIVFSFKVTKPSEWSELLYLRVKNHFDTFELNQLYSVQSAVEFEGIKRLLIKIYRSSGVDALKDHLEDCLDSYSYVNMNSWKSAMYKALVDSEWFFSEWIVKHTNY